MAAHITAVREIGPKSGRLVHLDMLRGLAALAVVVGHIRGFLLVDFGDLASPNFATMAIYFLAGLGHQAVIAFFALSGYLVGGKALRDMLSGTWSWPRYVVARLSRLWTVVVPALALTLALDLAGRALGGGSGYDGSYYSILSSGPSRASPVDHSPQTLLANLMFVQTIVAPTFGSNGPLWSLANEFWYYVVFPLAGFAIFVRASPWLRASAAICAVALAWLLPAEMMLLGAIWVAGAVASHLTTLGPLRAVFAHPIYMAVALLVAAASILAGFGEGGPVHELVLGAAWAALLPTLAALPNFTGLYARIASGLSEISYTLYATHFPILVFVYFVALAPRQWPPGPLSLGLAAALLSLTLIAATALWWCFERNTGRARTAALALLRRGRQHLLS